MRKITNKGNLPTALVKAVQNDNYSKGEADFSTTQLGAPSRIVALKKKHADELEEDVSDLIYSLMGKLGHSILEAAGSTDFVEKRLFHTMPDGTIISGCLDIVDGSIIEDWKFCSVYVAKEGVKTEWVQQASVNSYLCRHNNIKITGARYIALYRDWSKTKLSRERDYPQQQVQAFNVPLWSLQETERWIMERVASHKSADKSLPLCSDEERWCRGAKVAVMKPKRKTAVKLFDDAGSAQAFISQQKEATGLFLEERKGVNTRCQFYCPVLAFCEQAKSLGITPEGDMFEDISKQEDKGEFDY